MRLQSEDPSIRGYLPERVLQEDAGKELICQRCFRIVHYGTDEFGPPTAEEAAALVRAAVGWCARILFVVDLMDFEPSFSAEMLGYLKQRPFLVLLNKGDLLPKQTSAEEVEVWASERLRHFGLHGKARVVSGRQGFGVSKVFDSLSRGRWAVLGITNVGKSTLVERFLRLADSAGPISPTVSQFPGTTVERTKFSLGDGLEVLDTPGLVPTGRLSDLVCTSCVKKLIPRGRVQAKLYDFPAGTTMVVPGLAAVRALNVEPGSLAVGFTASEVVWQRVNPQKIERWLQPTCSVCSLPRWVTHRVRVASNMDLVVHGLGWLAIRKGAVDLEVTVPAGTELSERPSLVGPKG